MAAFVGATVSKSNPHGGDSYGLTPFIATRPMTSAALVAAKLKATIWSALATWLLVLVAIPLALTLSGTWPVVIERARRAIDFVGAPRAIAILLLGIAALVASTWKQLVRALYIGMSGREWVVKASVLLTLAVLTVLGPLVLWISSRGDVMGALWSAFPWIAAVLVFLKLSAASWIAVRLHDSGLLGGRALVVGAACWDAVVLALFGLVAWIVPAMIVPRYLLVLVAILGVPLARLSAAPLALAWNRHR